MNRMGSLLLASILCVAGLQADDRPKEKPQTPAMELDQLVKDFSSQQKEIISQFQKVKGEEQQKLLAKYQSLGSDFADKFYKLADDHPGDLVATDALFWIVGNAPAKSTKAIEKIIPLVKEMPLKDLAKRIPNLAMRGTVTPALGDALLKRIETDLKEQEAGDLLSNLAMVRGNPSLSKKATGLLLDHFPDHKGVENVCRMLGFSGDSGSETLRMILEKSKNQGVKATASITLAKVLASQADQAADKPEEAEKLVQEAEKILEVVINNYAKDDETRLKNAKKELKALQSLRVGKPAPEIATDDLDGKAFKLSDYRGKVVLLDFWGNW